MRTPLFEQHEELGAKIVPFAGWEMPVTYEGIREEHSAVRRHVGMFDVSHMGEVEVEGPGALRFLQRVLSNDVAKVAIGGAQYSCLCQEDGGVLGSALGIDLPPRFHVSHVQVGRRPALACGTGYTGEDGVELLIDPEVAAPIWAELLDAGVVPCGLGARDTLRLEVCYPLHGNELTPERNPVEAGLGWCCKEETGFVGSEAIARARAEGTAETLVAFTIEDKGIPREGNPVLHDGAEVGIVTSGTFSPSLEVGAGMAYVKPELAEVGTEVEIDVRGKHRPARIASKPLYP